jgi:glucose 1-dehydrogenase
MTQRFDHHFNRHRFFGRCVLITGASRGIGRATAERFAAEGAGVAINHFNDDEAAAAALDRLKAISPGQDHFAVPGDVADPETLTQIFKTVIQRFGRLDILVNNAGIQGPMPGDAFEEAAFARVLAVNLTAVAHGSSLAIQHFLGRSGGGTIVNTSSVHELIPKPGYLSYSASKGGVGNITRTLALEFASRGIRVNAVAPGAVTTDMNADWVNDPARKRDVERHIPMRRAGEAAEIAGVIAFLASEDASYITGQTIYPCGGLSLYADFATNWAS